MNKTQLKQRFQAGLVHLLASTLTAGLIAALIFMVWYPAPLADAQGVSRLLLILIAVDITIGPLVTILVFDRRKKSLKFDLAVVVILQLGFLGYGLHSIYGGRPALLVFNVDRFDAVPASSMDPEGLRLAGQQGKPGLPLLSPRIVGSRIPTDIGERNALTLSSGMGGADLPELAQYHLPYANVADDVRAKLLPLSELRQVNPLGETAWQALLGRFNLPEAELGYLPLKAKVSDCVVIIDRKTAEVLEILPLQPKWRIR